jgi:tRNA-specific adenosine deaminase 2
LPHPENMVFGPVPNRSYHEAFMRNAIDMAEFALASDETPVGCVFVHNGEIIGRGINGTNASLNVGHLNIPTSRPRC